MASMTFQVNDASTESGYPAVWVTITENANGTLSFTVTQQGGIVGDLRGIFFDLNNEAIRSSLSVTSAQGVTEFRTGDDSVKDLGEGANMNGLLGSDKGYDAGIEIGSAGIGKDDIQSYSFTLKSSTGSLSLQDFANVDFGVRLTSVGTIGGSRSDSSKIMETTSTAIDARDDSASVSEDATASGNVLANDATSGGTTTVTGWSGGSLGQAVTLENSEGVTLTLNADGSWSLDASAADALSQGETLNYSFTYSARNQTEATSWSDDTANFTVTVTGVNDGPVAGDDAASVVENADATTGTVLANDDDIDRLDTISVVSWSGGALGASAGIIDGAGASFTLNADGSYVLDASAADELSQGEEITQQFSYTLADNHGATDVATVSVTVHGANDGPIAEDDAGGSMLENGTLSGDVSVNDSDIDRLDTHEWSLVSFGGLGNLTLNDDGTWSYNANGAYDSLLTGQHVDLSFEYAMTDNHGASDNAVVSFRIEGVGVITPPPPPPPTPVDPRLEFLFNHGTNEFDHGWFPQLKDNTAEGFTGNDTLKIAGYGDIVDITIDYGNFNLGNPSIDDTKFTIDMVEKVRGESTRTEDVGYIVDYTSLAPNQINVTSGGPTQDTYDLFYV